MPNHHNVLVFDYLLCDSNNVGDSYERDHTVYDAVTSIEKTTMVTMMNEAMRYKQSKYTECPTDIKRTIYIQRSFSEFIKEIKQSDNDSFIILTAKLHFKMLNSYSFNSTDGMVEICSHDQMKKIESITEFYAIISTLKLDISHELKKLDNTSYRILYLLELQNIAEKAGHSKQGFNALPSKKLIELFNNGMYETFLEKQNNENLFPIEYYEKVAENKHNKKNQNMSLLLLCIYIITWFYL